MTYGDSPNGSDGGVFVEFHIGIAGSGPVPKYTEFPNNTAEVNYCLYWFDNSSTANVIQLLAVKAHSSGDMGGTYSGGNISLVYKDAHTGADKTAKEKDTVVHELGHQFDLGTNFAGHVDTYNAHPNHEGSSSDDCLMTYASDDTDGISEFCIECIDHVRELTDSL